MFVDPVNKRFKYINKPGERYSTVDKMFDAIEDYARFNPWTYDKPLSTG